MSKYSTCPKFLEFERLFGAPAVDDLLQRIVEAQANHGDSGGAGVSLSVTETSIGCYDLSGYMDYAGQEITFEISWGHGHGTSVIDFDFDADEVLKLRQQVLAEATLDQGLGDLLHTVLRHLQPVLAVSNLALIPNRAPARLNVVFDTQRAAVCVPGVISDPGLAASYPGIAQCELAFRGEGCLITVGLAALHPADDDDLVELMHWDSAFSATSLLSHEFKLNDQGLLDVEPAAAKLKAAWADLDTVGHLDGFSPLATLEHQFADLLLEACAP